MIRKTHNIALIGFDEAEAFRIVSLLGSFDTTFHRVAWGVAAIQLVSSREFESALLRFSDNSTEVSRFLEALRASDSQSRHAGAILLADAAGLAEARKFMGSGVNRVVPIEDPADALADAALSLLDVAHRFTMRAPIELSTGAGSDQTKVYCHTENLSLSGMLVSCSQRFQIGLPLHFVLSFPGEERPIRGTARVERTTDPRRERVLGIGASFQSFEDDNRSRLRNVLLRQVS